MSVAAASVERRQDVRIIGWVGAAHGASHFYQLALPPLFPFIHAQEGVSYTQLGFLIALFYFFSGVFQPFAGFLVDQIGPRRVLYAGIGSMAIATALYGLAPGYATLLVLVSISGLGNAVFHPADYTILSHRVTEQRVGRAFSFHAFVGFAGYAARATGHDLVGKRCSVGACRPLSPVSLACVFWRCYAATDTTFWRS